MAATNTIYRLNTAQSDLTQHNDKVATILRTITEPDADHDADCLPMHVIRLDDGAELECWPDELVARYRDYDISPTDPVPPIPGWQRFAWCFTHKDYDGPEDSRHGYAESVEACMAEIDERDAA